MKTLKQLRASLDLIDNEIDPLFEMFLEFMDEYENLIKPMELLDNSGEMDLPEPMKGLLLAAFGKGALAVLDIKRFGFGVIEPKGGTDIAYFSDEELQHNAMLLIDPEDQKVELDEAISELTENSDSDEEDPVLH